MSLQNSLSDMFQGMRFFIPEILILVWVLVFTGFEIFLGNAEKKLQSNLRFFIAYLGLIFGIIFGFQRGEMNYFGPVGHNLFFLNSEYYTYSILVLGMGLILIFVNHLVKKIISFEEIISFWAIILGALYTGASSHWLILLLGIETMTLGTYGLVAYKKSKLSYRAALPYLFFGLTITAIFIYGISLFMAFLEV